MTIGISNRVEYPEPELDFSHRSDCAALKAATEGAGLCTVIYIEGSFSRRIGAQLGIFTDGRIVGDLADGCLESALAQDIISMSTKQKRQIIRYGSGSGKIDFRLPCGGGLDILIDRSPNVEILGSALEHLEKRKPVTVSMPVSVVNDSGVFLSDQSTGMDDGIFHRRYSPELRLLVLGNGPEVDALERLASAFGVRTSIATPLGKSDTGTLSLGKVPNEFVTDPFTAVILLFHDHEWERVLLPWALQTQAFYIGAQGGALAREGRINMLLQQGVSSENLLRLHSPMGLIERARNADVLGLSVLASVVSAYETKVYD